MFSELTCRPFMSSVFVRLAAGTLPGNTRSSPALGLPLLQLAGLLQTNVPPRPVQVSVLGVRRVSRFSSSRARDRRRARTAGERRAVRDLLPFNHWRQLN